MLPQLVIHPTFDVPAAALRGSLDPTTGVFYKAPDRARVRTPLACDKCRVRKAKCTGDRPVCERCHNRGLTCHYSTDERRRKVKDKPARLGVRSNSVSESPLSTEPTKHVTQKQEEEQILGAQNALSLSFDQVVSGADPGIDSVFIEARRPSLVEYAFLPGLAGTDLSDAYQYPMSFHSPLSGFDNADSPGRTTSASTSTSTSPVLPCAYSDGLPPTPVNSYPGSPFAFASLSPSPLGYVDFASAYSLFSNDMAWCDGKDAFGENVFLDMDGAF